MTTRAEFVAEVMSWVGTPFHHEGRLKHVGVDCAGVVVGALGAVGVTVYDAAHYPKRPVGDMFERAINSETDPTTLELAMPGDLATFRFERDLQHISIIVRMEPTIRIVHAFAQVRKCVENDLDEFWRQRLVSVRRVRGLD